ncbi:lipase family protein [Alkalihalobacillus sp. MEB130]|uniref:lipase family protein n=1 Tax=Alkalihalobacillus sp. MEB130 TaxID=2976704 RepID=UPI0028DF8DF5|nr:lipase family protein [Alkalihalobacillus sp. MEB130]MDT8861312.1 lipase family protein [Alkalihalobacillus sp. MEB130]
MTYTHSIKRQLPLFLANCCLQTYIQYANHDEFTIPKGFKLLTSFKANAFGFKEWFGFILESKKSVIIAFRGTDSNPDWMVDAEVAQVPFPYTKETCHVHEGFSAIYQSCRDDIMDTLENIPLKKQIYVTGHSLGAALATLCSMDLTTHGYHVTLYNFASPRVGDPLFAQQFNEKIEESYRFVNIYDIVPLLPPESIYSPLTDQMYQYEHIKGGRTFGLQTDTLSGNHSIYTYIKGVKDL